MRGIHGKTGVGMLAERRVEVRGIELALAEHGVGGHPLLAVHGYTGAKEDFIEWLDPLSDRGWHGVAMDLRGHGMSDKPDPDSAYSLAELAADVLGVADALGWSEFTLIGHSMGGMVAQLLALEHPERLRGLVLLATGHGPVEGIDPELIDLAMTVVAEGGMDALADLLATMSGPLETPAHLRLLEEREGYAEYGDRNLRSVAPGAYAALGKEMVGAEDRLDALAALSVPTQVIVGSLDHSFLDSSRRLGEAIPGAEFVELEDAGHSPQFETPVEWWRALTGFLDSLD